MLNSASDYRFVDVTDIDIQGRIVPTEDINDLPLALRVEDFAWVFEAFLERGVDWNIDLYNGVLAELKTRLRKPVTSVYTLQQAYADGNVAARGWKASVESAGVYLLSDSDMSDFVAGSLLTPSDLRWPTGIDPDNLPLAPSADLMRAIFYNVNRIGGLWHFGTALSTLNDYPATYDIDGFETTVYTSGSDAEHGVHQDYIYPTSITAPANASDSTKIPIELRYYRDGSYTASSSTAPNRYNVTVSQQTVYWDVAGKYTYGSFYMQDWFRLRRATPYQTNYDYYSWRDVRDTPLCCFVSFDVYTGRSFSSLSKQGTVWFNCGILTKSENGRLSFPMPTMSQFRSMIRMVVPTETFDDSGANYEWRYRVDIHNVWVFDERSFRTTLPSAWTWTPNPLTP